MFIYVVEEFVEEPCSSKFALHGVSRHCVCTASSIKGEVCSIVDHLDVLVFVADLTSYCDHGFRWSMSEQWPPFCEAAMQKGLSSRPSLGLAGDPYPARAARYTSSATKNKINK
ncbi:hypothetical protein E2C01_045030 [Portunus trituberculatus]|uniref:Uncharacterized protein n=1 Tax=Portunus trituberculatus TaxID=210409 RepID=A0A5B7G100_PORTR|nr:hypothetical protein [Portunus trituberculatus]